MNLPHRLMASLGLLVFSVAATAIASPVNAQVAAPAPASAVESPSPAHPATSLGRLKHVKAGVLDIGYAEVGPASGSPVVLLHGWPYDIHSYAEVAPQLAARGYRVLVPYLRGYGTTRFLSPDTPRNGQPAALAGDVVAFMDALHIQRAASVALTGGRARQTSWPRCIRSG